MPEFETSRLRRPLLGGGIALLIVVLAAAAAYTWSGLTRERQHSEELTASNQALTASLQQMRSEVSSLTEKLNTLAAQPPVAAAPVREREISKPARARIASRRSPARTGTTDRRWQQVQARLADQQKEIASTREQVDQTRQDLDKKLSSTREELNGSIAKNHDELAALQKRGERNYYEFQLDKSKQFQKVGPLSISVRKVNYKHKYYDLALMVEDRQLEKKHVNLYEPLMLTLADRPQPIELVVNEIDKGQIKGYVSEPKYKVSELTTTAQTAAADAKGLQRR